MPENRSPLLRALLIALVVFAVFAAIVALGTLFSPDANAGSMWAGWNWR